MTKKITDFEPGKSKTAIAFFHYWEDGDITYQGCIKELFDDYSGDCVLYEWCLGQENGSIAATRSFFDSCTFYDSDYQMRKAYENHKNSKDNDQ